jgi:hypothetical protein
LYDTANTELATARECISTTRTAMATAKSDIFTHKKTELAQIKEVDTDSETIEVRYIAARKLCRDASI